MIVYFSTVCRSAPLQQGGEVVMLDWDRKTILARQPIIPDDPIITDPNPRGGTRGGRGILLSGDDVQVASYHSVHRFDRNLKPTSRFSNHNFADIHAMAWDRKDMWITSTVLDGAVKVDSSGRTIDSWWPREDPVIAERFGLSHLDLDKHADNRLSYLGRSHVEPGHTHLNAITLLDGRPLILLNKLGCVVQLHPTRVLIEDPKLRGAHDLVVGPDGSILINDTVGHAVRVYNPDGTLDRVIALRQFRPVQRIYWRFWSRGLRIWLGERSPSFRVGWWLMKNIVASRPIFVRGLCLTDRNTILIGVSPATILEVDCVNQRLVGEFTFTRDVNCAVHGLAFAPELKAEGASREERSPAHQALEMAGAGV